MPQHTVNEQLKNRSGAVNRRVDKLSSNRDSRALISKNASAANQVPARAPSGTPKPRGRENAIQRVTGGRARRSLESRGVNFDQLLQKRK